MTHLLCVIALASGPAKLNLPSLLYAPEPRLVHELGPKTAPKRVPAIFFYPKGFQEIQMNAMGADMSDVTITFKQLTPWPEALADLGLRPTGVSTKKAPDFVSAIPLIRNQLVLKGVKGLAANPHSHKQWAVTYSEFAVVNKDRARKLRAQIQSTTGPQHLALIRSCYDWCSKLHFSSS